MDDLCKALGDAVRMRIVAALARPAESACGTQGDLVCACDIERLVGLAQPTVSHHMRILVSAGLVTGRKSGRWVYYRLNRDRLRALAADLADLAGGDTDDTDASTMGPRAAA
jgi:ArsR family transcriptional regulator